MTAPASKIDYRPEIEGLRALAATLVAVCHIWLGGVSGGVDVFFVVSGFLVTLSLLSQRERRGRIQPMAFWANLLKRLLPMAYLVIAVVAVAAILVFPTLLWVDTIRHALASLLYLENWRLAFDAINYLKQNLDSSPFRHYWALSAQGQFYFSWPLLVLALLWRVDSPTAARQRLLWAFAAVFVASLVYSVVTTLANQPFAYYDSLARAWEFAIGALLALFIGRLRPGRWLSLALGWAGLGGLLVGALVLDISNQFPGYVALLPTLSAVAIIIAGSNPGRWGAPRLLGLRAMQRFGGISYAFYLWHWPVLVIYRQIAWTTQVSLTEGLAIMGLSFLLSVVTTRLVENPIRYSSLGRYRPARTFATLALLSLPVVALIGGWGLYTRTQTAAVAPLDLDDPRYPGARAVGLSPDQAPPPAPLYPAPINIYRDLPEPYASGCHQEHDDPELLRCVYGDPQADKTIAIVGGSHSLQWLPAFRVFAQARGYRVLNYTKSFCLFSSPAGFESVYPYPSCTQWNRALMTELLEIRPDLVFTTATRDGGPDEYIPQGFIEWFRRLGEHGIPVLAMRDNPWFAFEPTKCVDRFGRSAEQCRVPRAQLLAASDPARQLRASGLERVRFVDFSRFFCTSEVCFPELGNVLLYRDSHHITPSYMRTLAAYLADEVEAARNWPGGAR